MLAELIIAAASLVAGHASGLETAPQPPPSPRIEVRLAAPDADHAWQPGRWRWSHGQWQWEGGRWLRRPSPTSVWRAGRWQHGDSGWIYLSGGWTSG